MKDKRNKHIRILADKIVSLEKNIQEGTKVEESKAKLSELANSLSLEDLLEVDEYISRKNFLTK